MRSLQTMVQQLMNSSNAEASPAASYLQRSGDIMSMQVKKNITSPEDKLKRLQEHDVDLESGSSTKKLVTTDSEQQQRANPAQSEAQQKTGDKPSFKVVAHFVMAMKRFQASLNPTYTYGKVQEDSTGSSASSSDFVHPAQRVFRKTESQNGNVPERTMKKTMSSRGNKTTLLFKQLPDVPTET